MKGKETHSIELEPSMHEYLEKMVEEYKLRDVGKAVRCLINYARMNSEKEAEIFAEIRCLDC